MALLRLQHHSGAEIKAHLQDQGWSTQASPKVGGLDWFGGFDQINREGVRTSKPPNLQLGKLTFGVLDGHAHGSVSK